jgi:hypothetical protein
MGDQLVARSLRVHKHRKTHTHTQTLNIHALSGIRTHGPGFQATEDSARPRPLGYRDRLGRAIAQAVSRWLPTAAARGANPGLVMWDFVVD